ncbi:hypothetical protein D6817_00225 [Candidatus Pacearchaeota archaeon]|nr:MAG: hypothetical protein D6817_00225 [Candidatus Pacearchaeota archaeon]
MQEVLRNLRIVYSRPKYIALLLAVSLAFYELNVLAFNLPSLGYLASLGILKGGELLVSFSLGLPSIMSRSSFYALLVISVLLGMLVSLMVFKVSSRAEGNGGYFGFVGMLLGSIAPGCAACGIGLLPLLGISTAFLTFLPLKGLELSLLAILVLGFSIARISKDLTRCESCKLNLEMKGGN